MLRILLIDDEDLLTKSFSLLLEKQGYDVYLAKNGQDAQVMSEEVDFDLIIADIQMPGQNGVETVKTIRQTAKARATPVIFVTGFTDERIEKEARRLNPIGYLFKPFDNQAFLRLVDKGLGK